MGEAPRTLSGHVQRFARQQPAEAALLDHTGATDWAALDARADRLAEALARFGAGERVVLLVPQSGSGIALLIACERARIDALLISALYGEAWASARHDEIGARALLTVDGDSLRVLREGPAAPSGAAGGDPGVLVLTSGTTGRPKCARHSWQTLSGAVKLRDEYARTRWLIGYPISHFASLQVVAQVIFSGGTLVIPPDFAAETGMRLLRTHGPEYLCSTPSYARQLLLTARPEDWRATRLRQITLGGEIADGRLLRGLRAALPQLRVSHVYASTELGAVLTVTDGAEGFDGALLDSVKLKLVDGQLFARRTPRGMLGYLGDDAPDDGWVATGDLVEVVDGRAYFRGRLNDVINVGGYKVNPIEVEAVIRDVAGVQEACVVAHRSSILGSLPKAIVSSAPGVDRIALQAEILRHCDERLARHMVPRLIEFTDRVERSVGQKLVRRS